MANKKTTNNTQITTSETKEVSETTRCRQIISAYYAVHAINLFKEIATKVFHNSDGSQFVSAEEIDNTLSKVLTDTKEYVIVYTQPSDESNITADMAEVHAEFNKALPIGQKWFTKTAEISDATVVLRAYSNYLRYKADKDKALLRTAKKALSEMSQEELIKFILSQKNK